jgi:twinkle protein
VGVYDLEVHPINTSKQIVSKEVGVNFLRPDVEYSDEDLANSLRRLRDTGVQFYDRAGSRDWADIRNSMEEQHLLDGVCEFFLDPLTALISKYSASEANDALNTIMTDMADMVFKHPITIFCFSHVNNKPKTSTPHERGGKVLSSEFTGSRSLEKWSNYGFGLNRDRSEECPLEEQNISYLSMLYDRDFGRSTNIPLFYDERTTRYLEATGRL